MSTMTGSDRLATFIATLTGDLDRDLASEQELLEHVAAAMRRLVAQDDWLESRHAAPDPDRYQQYLLFKDPADRFSIVSFVWGPGQYTPIHDHGIWGVVGMLRGSEVSQPFELRHGRMVGGSEQILLPGDVITFSPNSGDTHRVRNAFTDRISISIHVYGGDIGQTTRHVFTEEGTVKTFVSGYSNMDA